jgi:hypothetical protein
LEHDTTAGRHLVDVPQHRPGFSNVSQAQIVGDGRVVEIVADVGAEEKRLDL